MRVGNSGVVSEFVYDDGKDLISIIAAIKPFKV